jgi:peptide/nickel transport system permease protein
MDRLWPLLREIVALALNPRSRLLKLYPFGQRTASQRTAVEVAIEPPLMRQRRLSARALVLNPPLVLGALIVFGLFALVLFGPVWAPTNPYIAAQHLVPHYDVQRGEYVSPPLPPSDVYPLGTDRWGNDLLSMLMHGARNTLVACAFVTMARVGVGMVLGGIAGWNEGKPSDALIMGAVGVITSLPTLISSIILIYALDIRRGLPVFILALSAVGWTEIAQYVRSEFLILRKRPFIEGARAVGLSGLAVAVRHVLPNILPQMLTILCLEMGAVMLLLGELGFVGVYIGGGSRIAIETDPFQFEFHTLVEVPEWGAMLADGFRWLRSRPFVVWPPAVAFFVAVVGFNLLGEGLRRLIEKGSISTAFLMRKRMLLVAAGLTLATVFVIRNTGPAPWFSRVAQAFNGEAAFAHIEALTEMEGRGAGQKGGERAAAYISDHFQAYGLEPGWKHHSYLYPIATQLVRPVEQPSLALIDANGDEVHLFRHQVDYGFWIEGHGGSGTAEAPLTFVGFDREARADGVPWPAFKGLDLRDRIVLLVEGNTPADMANEALIRGAEGVLWVVGNGSDAGRGICQSQFQLLGAESLRQPSLPVFCIQPAVAAALLEGEELSLQLLLDREGGADTSGPGWFSRDLKATVRMALRLSEPEDVEVPCVLGYIPGSDYDLAGQLVILYAAYDGLGIDPNGRVYPGANDSASGIAVMLELARLWEEQDLDARRSVLLVAWGGSQLQDSGAARFLTQSASFRHLPSSAPIKPALIFQLEGLGAGGEGLWIDPSSSKRLADLLRETASEMGVALARQEDVDDRTGKLLTRRIPSLYVSWSGPVVSPEEDVVAHVDVSKLETAGEALALALTRVLRQTVYQ